MTKGYLARHNVSFEIDSLEDISELIIKEQNPHLTDEQVSEVLEILIQIKETENVELPPEVY